MSTRLGPSKLNRLQTLSDSPDGVNLDILPSGKLKLLQDWWPDTQPERGTWPHLIVCKLNKRFHTTEHANGWRRAWQALALTESRPLKLITTCNIMFYRIWVQHVPDVAGTKKTRLHYLFERQTVHTRGEHTLWLSFEFLQLRRAITAPLNSRHIQQIYHTKPEQSHEHTDNCQERAPTDSV